MNPIYNQNIPVELEHLKPLGDFVLVKRLPDHDKQGRIWLPGNRKNPELGLRRGVVVACGPGDAKYFFRCLECHAVHAGTKRAPGDCEWCGGNNWEFASDIGTQRHEMNVSPGDHILYTRAPANDVRLNGEEYTFLHEEQHPYAVLESEAA